MKEYDLSALERLVEAGSVWSVVILPVRPWGPDQEVHLLVTDARSRSQVFVLRGPEASSDARRRLATKLTARGIPYEGYPASRHRSSA